MIQNSWITKGIAKSSKKKQKLYGPSLKTRTSQNEQKNKNYKNILEIIKKKAKKMYHFKKLLIYLFILFKSLFTVGINDSQS